MLEAAEQGVTHAVGVDSNPHMIHFAEVLARKAEVAGQRPSFYCMDARDLGREAHLQEVRSSGWLCPSSMHTKRVVTAGYRQAVCCSQAFDLALLPLGTLSHALTNADACAWLRAARGCLREGGLLCIELAHPGDAFDGTLVEVSSPVLPS